MKLILRVAELSLSRFLDAPSDLAVVARVRNAANGSTEFTRKKGLAYALEGAGTSRSDFGRFAAWGRIQLEMREVLISRDGLEFRTLAARRHPC